MNAKIYVPMDITNYVLVTGFKGAKGFKVLIIGYLASYQVVYPADVAKRHPAGEKQGL